MSICREHQFGVLHPPPEVRVEDLVSELMLSGTSQILYKYMPFSETNNYLICPRVVMQHCQETIKSSDNSGLEEEIKIISTLRLLENIPLKFCKLLTVLINRATTTCAQKTERKCDYDHSSIIPIHSTDSEEEQRELLSDIYKLSI